MLLFKDQLSLLAIQSLLLVDWAAA